MRKALIFGASGQDGIYLSALFKSKGFDVIGISRRSSLGLMGDVGDYSFVRELIKDNQPDYIFHLAANSSTKHSLLFENHDTISTGTLNILESAYKHSPNSKIFLSGSGLQFVNNGVPISESDPFEASSPYSISRIQSVYAARYFRSLGLKVYIGYFFNHDSPHRGEKHVNQKIVQAVKRIASGSKEKIVLYDIGVYKEFSFAGDIMNAVIRLVENNDIYEAVIGSGKAYSIADWIKICFNYYNMPWDEKIEQDLSV